MADDDRKKKQDDEDEAADAEESKADESDSDESEKESADKDGDDDEAAQRVAEALGVDGDGEGGGEKAEEKEPEAPPNRAARRREEAMERRRKRRGQAAKPAEKEEDEELPKDKNARAKALLQKRREQASSARPVALLPGEMVDDALARSASAFSKWFRTNFAVIQWVILAGIVGGAGFLIYNHYSQKGSAAASDALAAGAEAERGRVMAEDKRTDEEKEGDTTKIFKTAAERSDTALASYERVIKEHQGTGPEMLARMGEAGVYLDKRDWDKALEAYDKVLSSPLAANDLDVKGRALEGIGLAKEGKGDVEGALAAYKQVEGVDIKGMKELGEYHQARLLVKKGEKEKAKDLLKKAHEALAAPSTEGKTATSYLQSVVDDALRALDPTAVPAKPAIGGPKGNTMTKEQMDQLLRQLEERQKKQPTEGH